MLCDIDSSYFPLYLFADTTVTKEFKLIPDKHQRYTNDANSIEHRPIHW